MALKRIIPCLDIKEGQVVKGNQFGNLRFAGIPSELSAKYEDEGADELVWLDITATNESRSMMLATLEDTASTLFIPLTAGGGIGSIGDMSSALCSGADKVSVNTAAVKRPELIRQASEEFGRQCVVASIDVARNSSSGMYEVYTNSGTVNTGMDAVGWAKRVEELGAGEILLTSRDRDGTTSGYDCIITRQVADAVSIPVIASGGCGRPEHIAEVLSDGRADAALAASVFHYGTFTIDEAKKAARQAGERVRFRTGEVETRKG